MKGCIENGHVAFIIGRVDPSLQLISEHGVPCVEPSAMINFGKLFVVLDKELQPNQIILEGCSM